MKNWDSYKLLLALHRAGTVRGAAKALGVNHATISRRLSQIHLEVRTPIFEQKAQGYKVTESGMEYIRAAEKFELLAFEAERRQRALSENLSGTIRLSIGEPLAQILLKDNIARFSQEHPNIDLIVETSVDLIDLDRSEADVVVRASNSPPDHLVGRRLFPFYLCEYCAKDYLQDTPYEARQWLHYSKSQQPRAWIESSTHPDAATGFQSDDLMFLLKAAESGFGMIRTACYMGDASPHLMRLPDAQTIKAQDLWVLTHPDLRRTKRIKSMMQHLATALESKRDRLEGRML